MGQQVAYFIELSPTPVRIYTDWIGFREWVLIMNKDLVNVMPGIILRILNDETGYLFAIGNWSYRGYDNLTTLCKPFWK